MGIYDDSSSPAPVFPSGRRQAGRRNTQSYAAIDYSPLPNAQTTQNGSPFNGNRDKDDEYPTDEDQEASQIRGGSPRRVRRSTMLAVTSPVNNGSASTGSPRATITESSSTVLGRRLRDDTGQAVDTGPSAGLLESLQAADRARAAANKRLKWYAADTADEHDLSIESKEQLVKIL